MIESKKSLLGSDTGMTPDETTGWAEPRASKAAWIFASLAALSPFAETLLQFWPSPCQLQQIQRAT
jgi:hypothetical protein